MRSLSDLAASYEEWAAKHETTAAVIMSDIDSIAVEIRDQRRQRASRLTAEAAELRMRAAELRAPYIANKLRRSPEAHRFQSDENLLPETKLSYALQDQLDMVCRKEWI